MLHHGIAEDYARQIDALDEALADPTAELEAIPRLRALIDHITLRPRVTRGVDVEVTTRLEAMLRLAAAPAIPSTVRKIAQG